MTLLLFFWAQTGTQVGVVSMDGTTLYTRHHEIRLFVLPQFELLVLPRSEYLRKDDDTRQREIVRMYDRIESCAGRKMIVYGWPPLRHTWKYGYDDIVQEVWWSMVIWDIRPYSGKVSDMRPYNGK
jgi:hypothetical protein